MPAIKQKISVIEAKGELQIAPLEGNVLTLDFVDVTAGGETKKGAYFYKANQFAFAKNGMPRNPWDSSVQFKDELITKTFRADSGFEATYRFTIEGPRARAALDRHRAARSVHDRLQRQAGLGRQGRTGGWTSRSAGSRSPRPPRSARTP